MKSFRSQSRTIYRLEGFKYTEFGNNLTCFRKLNSWTYNFVEVSGHNLGSSQTWGFHIQWIHYQPVSNHFCCTKCLKKSPAESANLWRTKVSSLLTWKERNGLYSFNWLKKRPDRSFTIEEDCTKWKKQRAHPNKPVRKDRTASPSDLRWKESLYHSRKDWTSTFQTNSQRKELWRIKKVISECQATPDERKCNISRNLRKRKCSMSRSLMRKKSRI